MGRLAGYHERFEYDDWANRQVLEKLRGEGLNSARSRTLLAHIVGAQEVWLSRLEPGEPLTVSWPELDLAQIDARLESLRGTWAMKLDQAGEATLDAPVTYNNLAGKPFSTPLRQILDHVLFHGAYHRGQIAMQLRSEGVAPVSTDFILFARR